MPQAASPGYATFPGDSIVTAGQALDQFELLIASGYTYNVVVTQHATVLANAGFSGVQIANYEASLDVVTPGANSQDGFALSAEILRHPRAYRLQLAHLQALANRGVVLSNQFFFGGFFVGEFGVTSGWTAWFGWNQQPGTGDPAIDTVNLSNPLAADQVKSEQGGAIKHWASLVPGSISPPPKPKRRIPGRNGQIKATGFPRGAFRPTR